MRELALLIKAAKLQDHETLTPYILGSTLLADPLRFYPVSPHQLELGTTDRVLTDRGLAFGGGSLEL